MLISKNRQPTLEAFTVLVNTATSLLNQDAKLRTQYYSDRNGILLEDDVKKALDKAAVNTPFANSIQKISGKNFPDIIANKYYGVEVKSSKKSNWITLGGSVNESTRVNGVERIFITFGKLNNPIEFKSRPYEDCLEEVVVTHYPRYKINMMLPEKETIFTKMKISYDELRQNTQAVEKIIAYYRSQLTEGESLWWLGKNVIENEQGNSLPMKIRMWRTLTPDEKHKFMIYGFALFPEILSNTQTKYERFSLWLVTNYGILATSLRDTFSAGGQKNITTKNKTYLNIPMVLKKLNDNNQKIKEYILNTNSEILSDTWQVNKVNSDRIKQYIELLSNNYSIHNYDIIQTINDIFAI